MATGHSKFIATPKKWSNYLVDFAPLHTMYYLVSSCLSVVHITFDMFDFGYNPKCKYKYNQFKITCTEKTG